ncbi:hypothetical protein PGTUg99_030893 [Puccinia graminis f. sp. tritici]|uniref:F-box domain-containing protein n=1 Tax=Puccinia graminis f. sp. tritici TaxID=56615 RepID=A0A5B0RVX1_PUCGR|nr:hypothetical protein PGTUg99_030893 [Puccinia graminis f. sp. tritici]
MVTVLDLPEKVLELVFDNLAADIGAFRSQATCLRLVCSKWEPFLYNRYLYRVLTFRSFDRAISFIRQIDQNSQSRPVPICRYLYIYRLDTIDDSTKFMPDRKTKVENLDALVELFSDSIEMLSIEVDKFLTLPRATIERIGRIKNLRHLTIGIYSKAAPSKILHSRQNLRVDSVPLGLPTDTECLHELLAAAQGLVTLSLEDFRPVCSPETIRPTLSNHKFSSITRLDLEIPPKPYTNGDEMIGIFHALPNLKKLKIRGLENGQSVLPLFEIVRETLEEIYIYHQEVLMSILGLEFPNLRVFKIGDWTTSLSQCLRRPMFSKAPLEVLALMIPFDETFLVLPFESLPCLKKLVFGNSPMSHKNALQDSRDLLKSCRENGVKVVLIPSQKIADY